jgi:hypothetical protein
MGYGIRSKQDGNGEVDRVVEEKRDDGEEEKSAGEVWAGGSGNSAE